VGQSLKVLMIEDREDDALLAADQRRRAVYDATCHRVETAPEVKAALAREPWDLILSDYNLPGMGGMQVLQLYKDSGLDIPFVVMSGRIGEVAVAEALRSGAHDFVSKDHASVLGMVVKNALRESASRIERGRENLEIRRLNAELMRLNEDLRNAPLTTS
jgi:DNA-binding NtrC family response regulator